MKFLRLLIFLHILFLACPKYMLVEINNELTDSFFYETECGDIYFYGIYSYPNEKRIKFTLDVDFEMRRRMNIDSVEFITQNESNLDVSINRAYSDTIKYSSSVYVLEIPQGVGDSFTMKLDKTVKCNNEYVPLPNVKFTLK